MDPMAVFSFTNEMELQFSDKVYLVSVVKKENDRSSHGRRR
jgi:hypothetical protein